MSSIPYSGGFVLDSTLAAGSRSALVTNLIAALLGAGWSSISGSGTDQVLQSAATSAGNSISVRIYDPASGNCARVKLRDQAGALIGQDHYLLAGSGKTYRIIASQYNFFVMTAGVSPAREFLCAGTLAIPTWLESYLTDDLGFIQGNAISDTDTTARYSFREHLTSWVQEGASGCRATGIAAGELVDFSGPSGNAGAPALIIRQGSGAAQSAIAQWADGTLRTLEAEIAWSPSGAAGDLRTFGTIHNCMLLMAALSVDDASITDYDGNAWQAITGSNSGSANARPGTLLYIVGSERLEWITATSDWTHYTTAWSDI
jgi:hypothetical protein